MLVSFRCDGAVIISILTLEGCSTFQERRQTNCGCALPHVGNPIDRPDRHSAKSFFEVARILSGIYHAARYLVLVFRPTKNLYY